MRRDLERLNDILQAIERIGTRPELSHETLMKDEMLQVWVVHHLWIIGEAARSISPELRGRQKHVPWGSIIEQRNVLIHRYFRIDAERVWAFVKEEMPILKAQIEGILADLREESDTISQEE